MTYLAPTWYIFKYIHLYLNGANKDTNYDDVFMFDWFFIFWAGGTKNDREDAKFIHIMLTLKLFLEPGCKQIMVRALGIYCKLQKHNSFFMAKAFAYCFFNNQSFYKTITSYIL